MTIVSISKQNKSPVLLEHVYFLAEDNHEKRDQT